MKLLGQVWAVAQESEAKVEPAERAKQKQMVATVPGHTPQEGRGVAMGA